MSLPPSLGSAIICLTLIACVAAETVAHCNAPEHGTGPSLLQLRSERAGITDPVQELPTDEATSVKNFCRFDGYLPYWAAIGERLGDYAVACTNDFLCEKMQAAATQGCGFEVKKAECVSGIASKDYKGLIDAINGSEFSKGCGYESLGPGKVFAQSCEKRGGYITKSFCESRCETWDDCTGYMTSDRGRVCSVVGRVSGDCPAGYSHAGYSFSLASDPTAESFAKISRCYTKPLAGGFLFFGHSFSCEDFKDYRERGNTAEAAAAALEYQRKAAERASAAALVAGEEKKEKEEMGFCSMGGVPGRATGGVPVCCGSGCGKCGGVGCGQRPGGGKECCTGSILRANRPCDGPEDTACVVPS